MLGITLKSVKVVSRNKYNNSDDNYRIPFLSAFTAYLLSIEYSIHRDVIYPTGFRLHLIDPITVNNCATQHNVCRF